MTEEATMATTLEIPYPPSANKHWRSIGRGRVLLSEDGRRFRSLVAAAWLASPSFRPPLMRRVEVTLWLSPPDRRRRDIDNCVKPTLDALGHAGLFGDDEQVDVLVVRRGHVVRGGRCVVSVAELADG